MLTVPVVPPLNLRQPPTLPTDFAWPDVTVWTIKDMANPVNACHAYKIGPESLEEESLADYEASLFSDYQLDRISACTFAVHGYDHQRQLDLEALQNRIASALQKAADYISYLRATLIERQALLEQTADTLKANKRTRKNVPND